MSGMEKWVVEACQCHSPMQWAVRTSAQDPGANGLSARGPAWGPQSESLSPGEQLIDSAGLQPQDVLCDGDSPCMSCARLAQDPHYNQGLNTQLQAPACTARSTLISKVESSLLTRGSWL